MVFLWSCHVEDPPLQPSTPPPLSQPNTGTGNGTNTENNAPLLIEPHSQLYIEDKLLNIELPHLRITKIKTMDVRVRTITRNEKSSSVNLNNITLVNGELINKTPYEIKHLYIISDGIPVNAIFSSPLPPFSISLVSPALNSERIINLTRLSNITFEYEKNPSEAGRKNSRNANMEERNTAEHVQMYDRFMMNAPSTLNEITEQLVKICKHNSTCNSYNASPENYAIDTYFSKSVSGLNSSFWINPDVWGLANRPGLESVKSNIWSNQNIWMSPALMNYVNNADILKRLDGWQALVHELYHNFGLSHDSGWASSNGIDDLFGEKTVDSYLIDNVNLYITSNIIFDTPTLVNNNTFKFKIYSQNDNIETLNMRILSRKPFEVDVMQNGKDEVVLTFINSPLTDLYVSFYSASSQQMATFPITLIKFISKQSEISPLSQNLPDLLNTFRKINVSLSNGNWIKTVQLPSEGVDNGSEINFSSSAGFDTNIVHDGVETLLTSAHKLEFKFDGTKWQYKIL